jgi:hypothetical protein
MGEDEGEGPCSARIFRVRFKILFRLCVRGPIFSRTTVVSRARHDARMNESKAHSTGHAPLIVQTFPADDAGSLYAQVFGVTAASEGLRHIRRAKWNSAKAFETAMAPEYLRQEDRLLADFRDDCDLNLTLLRRTTLISVFVCAKYGEVSLVVAGRDAESAEACLEEHRQLFEPRAEDLAPQSPRVQFGYWYLGEKGPEREEKDLAVPSWEQIRDNYAAQTCQAMARLTSGFKPGVGGRLALWHGKPGTGKTFAIRALAWEWREWCQFEYVFDPENLFGSRADYLAKIVIDGDQSRSDEEGRHWRILVLEDTGELLSMDAKERAGQGLSRLLNAVDGLLGQGSRVLLLITTNEELGTLHPAVTRPGRCASQIEFLPLSSNEATLWLSARTSNGVTPKGARTIAELYGLLEGRTVPERSPIGFAT